MALTIKKDRQYGLLADVDCRIANIGASNGYTINIPVNGILLDVVAVVATAFNSETTTTLTVTDGTDPSLSAVNIKAAANTRYTSTISKFYPSGGSLTVSLAETGAAATAGRVIVVARYAILGRGQEVQAS